MARSRGFRGTRRHKTGCRPKTHLQVEILEPRDLPSGLLPSVDPLPAAQTYHVRASSDGGTVMPLSTSSATGTFPAAIQQAYGISQISFPGDPLLGTGETIAIVDAYDDPNIASDLVAFDQYFSIPNPPSFTKENQYGGTSSLPAANSGWITEIALDVEWSHAIAPGANILLVEANDSSLTNLLTAVATAADQPGVAVVSMSLGQYRLLRGASLRQRLPDPDGPSQCDLCCLLWRQRRSA